MYSFRFFEIIRFRTFLYLPKGISNKSLYNCMQLLMLLLDLGMKIYIVMDIAYCFFFQLNMTDIVDESNEKHLEPWSEACQRDKIENTPLSPYLDQVMIHG